MSEVADDDSVVMAGDAQIGLHEHAARTVERHAEIRGQGGRCPRPQPRAQFSRAIRSGPILTRVSKPVTCIPVHTATPTFEL